MSSKNTHPVDIRRFSDDGATLNNPYLPLILVRATGAEDHQDPAAWFERRFVAHDWRATWRWTVYPYHHYHSTNHEVLGVASGTATILFGGIHGEKFDVKVGDVVVIPAGVGHKLVDSSPDFQVVGAYPGGHEPDTIVSGKGDIAASRTRIAGVAAPAQDPVFGTDGPVWDHWISENPTR